MDERDFKRHLAALARGQHHPEEHDWDGATTKPSTTATKKKVAAKKVAAKRAVKKA